VPIIIILKELSEIGHGVDTRLPTSILGPTPHILLLSDSEVCLVSWGDRVELLWVVLLLPQWPWWPQWPWESASGTFPCFTLGSSQPSAASCYENLSMLRVGFLLLQARYFLHKRRLTETCLTTTRLATTHLVTTRLKTTTVRDRQVCRGKLSNIT